MGDQEDFLDSGHSATMEPSRTNHNRSVESRGSSLRDRSRRSIRSKLTNRSRSKSNRSKQRGSLTKPVRHFIGSNAKPS